MAHGYYDPRNPGYHVLNDEEFEKVCIGSISALITSWCVYLGTAEVKRMLFRVASHPDRWQHAETCSTPTDELWDLEELKAVCETTLMRLCGAWASCLGRELVASAVKFVLEESSWDEKTKLAEVIMERLIKQDREEQKQEMN